MNQRDKKFYITTPIYYVNGEPHIGHAYTTVLADVLSGYYKLFGYDKYFLTGTDEHGQKVQEAAEKLKLTPKEHCDRMVVHFRGLWEKLGIKYDDFIRTTEKRHIDVVRDVLNDINEKGDIYIDEFEGWYCVQDERYFTDKDLIDGNCPECRRPVKIMKEKNYFFRMSKYQDWLIDYIKKHKDFIMPEFRKNEVLGFLRQPLKDLCISRPKSRLSWGVSLPFDENYVCYVWFDALLNYYSAVKDKNLWPATVHLIGKDILTTHSVYWPIMLKAAGLDLPKTIFAHGWWLAEDAKMSKSLGNVVKPLEMADKYGTEQFRYFLMRDMTPGNDASFSEPALVNRLNTDLANDLGNMLSRLTTLIYKFFDGKIPENGSSAPETLINLKNILKDTDDNIRSFKIDSVAAEALEPVRAANRYLEEKAPWKLAKTDKIEAGKVLYNALECLRISAVLLSPVIPEKSAEILDRLGASGTGFEWGELKSGNIIKKGDPLFPRIELKMTEKPVEIDKPPVEEAKLVSIDDFKKFELRVAEILTAEKIEGADKLLKIQVDIGTEKRQLVAGIAQFYSVEELPGKKIIIVANLEKAKIRGVESQGMLLAASKGKDMKLLTIDGDIPVGAIIS